MFTPKKFLFLVFDLILFFSISFSFFNKLGLDYVNTDQPLWLQRSENFYRAITTLNFSQTYQQYHPGVTVMYLVSLGQKLYQLKTKNLSTFSLISTSNFPLYNFYTKLFLVSTIFVLLLLSYYLINRLSNRFVAALFLLLLSFEPFYLANVRNLHLDALLSAFLIVSFLLYLISLTEKSKKFAIFSGIFCGLALLTKTPGVFTFVLTALISLIFILLKKITFKEVKPLFLHFVFSASVLFIVLFPAMWVSPITTLKNMIVEGALDTGIKGGHTHFIDQKRIRNPGPLYYLTILKYRTTPILLIVTILSVLFLIKILTFERKKIDSKRLLVLSAVLFIFLFTLILSFLNKKNDRYITAVFPFLCIFASCSFYLFQEDMLRLIRLKKISLGVMSISLISVFLVQRASLNIISPDFFAYYSPVFGGIKKAQEEIYLNQGGTAMLNVATYLKSLDLPKDTIVGTFNPYTLDVWTNYNVILLEANTIKTYNYVVLPIQRGIEYTKGYKLKQIIRINGVSYWEIYERNKKI